MNIVSKYVMMKSKYSNVEGKVRIGNGVYFGEEEKLVPEIRSKLFFFLFLHEIHKYMKYRSYTSY